MCGHEDVFNGDATKQQIKCDECGEHYDFGQHRPELDVFPNSNAHFVDVVMAGTRVPVEKAHARLFAEAILRLALG
jgi:hypothetical protein